MLKLSQITLSFSIISIACASIAHAENRAIVYGTTCLEYEQTLDDVATFGSEAVREFNALSANGWNVKALYGGKSAWCVPGQDAGCVPSKTGRAEQILSKSTLPISQVKMATKANLLNTIQDAVQGPNALRAGDQLLLSIITHGNETIFCAADGIVTHQSLVPLLAQLKNRGVKVAFDANHCFSGGAVKTLSPVACVVGVSSSTTTGLGGSTNLEAILNLNSHASFEDLFLARLVSPNSLLSLRQPEISGFRPGNTINDQVSNYMYFGDKYLLTNDTLTNMCAMNGGMGKECNLIQGRLANYQTLASPLNFSLANDSGNAFRSLYQKYFSAKATALADLDINSIFQEDFNRVLNQNWNEYLMLMQQSIDAKQKYDSALAQIKNTTFEPFHLVVAGTDIYPGLQEIVDSEQIKWTALSLSSDGHIMDPIALSQYLMTSESSLNWFLRDISNTYFSKRAQRDDPLTQDDLETLRVILQDNFRASFDTFYAHSKSTDSPAKVKSTLLALFPSFKGWTENLKKKNEDFKKFTLLLSGHIAFGLTQTYFDYRNHLANDPGLNAEERSDKNSLEACQAFNLK